MENGKTEFKNCVVIPDDFAGYDKRLYSIPKHYQDLLGNVLIPYGMVQDRIKKVASDMFNDFVAQKRTPLSVICVLKGGYRFFNDLLVAFDNLNVSNQEKALDVTIDFIRVKSYVGDKSTGDISIKGIEDWDVAFRYVECVVLFLSVIY